MDELIKKLEEAKQGSRELDDDIGEALGLSPQKRSEYYTTSIDAALMLVPDEHIVYATFFTKPVLGKPCWVCCAPPGLGGKQSHKKRRHLEATAATPALALCIAAVKARQQTRGDEG